MKHLWRIRHNYGSSRITDLYMDGKKRYKATDDGPLILITLEETSDLILNDKMGRL